MRTYRSVADPSSLLPAERDPLTGRRIARRDDKRRERHRARRPRRPWLIGGAVAVVVIAMASGVVALTAGDDPSSGRTRTGGSGAASGSGNRADDFAAGAITADYRGGHLVTETCVDSSGATCVPPKFDWEPLVVRCTAEGCTATIFNTTIALDDSPASYQTAFGYEDPACGTAPVTGSLRGVGHVIEHGLERPRRIVGRLRLDATAHRIPTADCLGGVREFAYDATKA